MQNACDVCVPALLVGCSLPQFGGSSVASADRMREVADIVCSFPEHLPVVVLSAMGKVGRPGSTWRHLATAVQQQQLVCRAAWHAAAALLLHLRSLFGCPVLPVQTTNLLLQAGDEALRTSPGNIASLAPLRWAG